MKRSMPLNPVHFTADHPFLFYIQDQHSGLVLFAGRLTALKPATSKDEL